MKYIIIDDEPDAIDVLEHHLHKIPFMDLIASFRDPLDGLEYLQNNNVDLLFLDINMPKLSGINFPKFLEKPPLIIYTTAYSEYALESYELKAVDYLLKPIAFDRLLKAVMKAKEILKQQKGGGAISAQSNKVILDQTVFIKSGSEFHQLAIQKIKYIESDGNYVTFYTTKRAILARYKISEVIDLLPKEYFVRVHRSYIVAIKHIEVVKKHCVVIDGVEIPISSNYRDVFLTFIENFSKKNQF